MVSYLGVELLQLLRFDIHQFIHPPFKLKLKWAKHIN